MNRGDWILGLLKDYKKNLGERKINLNDDFIKFIRFAQWKLDKTGQGIFAMITSNTFLDGVTHRQMRRSLMDTFDEIYVYNLHGSRHEDGLAPDGTTDENVFDIRQGVSINIFVKFPKKHNMCVVKFSDLWGLRKHKFSVLLEENFSKTKWKDLSPKYPNWLFAQGNEIVEDGYSSSPKITEVYPKFNTGIQTGKDEIVISFEKDSLARTLTDFKNLSLEELKNRYALTDSAGWKTEWAKKDVLIHQGEIKEIDYRPFDKRYTYYTGISSGFMKRPRTDVMDELKDKKNIALITTRQYGGKKRFIIYCTNSLIEMSSQPFASYIVSPLYINRETEQSSLFANTSEKKVNISPNITGELAEKLNLVFISEGCGDLKKDFGPEDIFYYTYAVFHSPSYRSRYAEQLKIDFPRLPLTSNIKLFSDLVVLGTELVSLHLLGENPFEKSKTIFDDTSKWHIKIGGEKPADLEDWKVTEVRYDEKTKRVYVNSGQYFEGIEKEVWEFMIGGYQVSEKWLKDRKKAGRVLSPDDSTHYMKIVVSLRETIRIMQEIDKTIPSWPIK